MTKKDKTVMLHRIRCQLTSTGIEIDIKSQRVKANGKKYKFNESTGSYILIDKDRIGKRSRYYGEDSTNMYFSGYATDKEKDGLIELLIESCEEKLKVLETKVAQMRSVIHNQKITVDKSSDIGEDEDYRDGMDIKL